CLLTRLKKISLTHFRNYKASRFDFPHRITAITGRNGSGKTNLMDAIYLLCFTKSYFTNTHAPLILHQENGFRVEGEFEHNGDTTHICQVLKQGKKEIFRDQVLYEKISDHIGSFNAVMIAPDDLELINGGAE